jgi:hypothetical protein
MAWYHNVGYRRVLPGGAGLEPASLTAAAEPPAVTAAAVPAAGPSAQFMRHTDRWQNEVWGYFDSLGEFNYGVSWLANMLSRVRLRAGQMEPGNDEPTVLDTGPAADLIQQLGNGIGGRSEIMKRLTVQLSVPGEGYLIGEKVNGLYRWQVRAVDEVRAVGAVTGRTGYQVTDEDNPNLGTVWRDLAEDSMVPIRVWRPHDRFYHLATSPARSALTAMRELELVNRHITAQYLSRLASAGVLILPEEVSFPVREEFADAEDPFMEEWITVAAEAIKTPGTASAVIPIPLRVPAEWVKDVQHLDFTLKVDDQIIAKRDQAIRRVATQLDIPSDVMLGLGDSNHWSAWAVEESGLKVHIAPLAEIICAALTTGYLQPLLAAAGVTDPSIVVWYDLSELTLRPDKSINAQNAYDRLELSSQAYRREIGMSEDDAPTQADLRDQALKSLIRLAHGAAPGAVDVLVGTELVTPATSGPGAAQEIQGVIPAPGQTGEPDEHTPPAGPTVPAAPAPSGTPPAQATTVNPELARRMRQGKVQHAVMFRLDGRWDLRHPEVCRDHSYSCPFTEAVMQDAPVAQPGTPGTYLCHLDAFGRVRLDGLSPYLDTTAMESTLVTPHTRVNGQAHV